MDYRPRKNGRRPAYRFARGLGWFSIGLGLAELVMPRTLARLTGLQGNERLLQAYGLREIATGIGILASQNPTPWIWLRVGGDALDLATLYGNVDDRNPRLDNTSASIMLAAGVSALDVGCAQALRIARQRQRWADANGRLYRDRSGFPRSPESMRGAAVPGGTRQPTLVQAAPPLPQAASG